MPPATSPTGEVGPAVAPCLSEIAGWFARLLISEMAGPGAITFSCIAVTLVIFFAFIFAANRATHDWTEVPVNWQQLRFEWEIAHAVNAALTFAGFCALTVSVLLTRD
jgi:hypothetical protein